MENIRYRCGQCTFEFSMKEDVAVRSCPSCIRPGVQILKRNFASKILK